MHTIPDGPSTAPENCRMCGSGDALYRDLEDHPYCQSCAELVRRAQAVPPAPQPILRGRFSIFETPAGGYHLTWRAEDAEGPDADQHIPIPPHMVKLARTMMRRRGGLFGPEN